MDAPRLTDAITEAIATLEGVDRQSIYRRALGMRVRGRVAARIDRALAAYGLVPPDTQINASQNEAG